MCAGKIINGRVEQKDQTVLDEAQVRVGARVHVWVWGWVGG